MKSLNIKRIGAVLTGAAMLASSALAATVVDDQATSPNIYSRSFYIDDATQSIDVQIGVGSSAQISDGIAAAKIAAKLGNLAFSKVTSTQACTVTGATCSCSAPSISGSVSISAATEGGGESDTNELLPNGILLEEELPNTVPTEARPSGGWKLQAPSTKFSVSGEDTLLLGSFDFNGTTKTFIEQVVVGGNIATQFGGVRYNEENESNPAFEFVINDCFVNYSIDFTPDLSNYDKPAEDLTGAQLGDEIPEIPVFGDVKRVFEIDGPGEMWEISAGDTRVYSSVGEGETLMFGTTSISVDAVMERTEGGNTTCAGRFTLVDSGETAPSRNIKEDTDADFIFFQGTDNEKKVNIEVTGCFAPYIDFIATSGAESKVQIEVDEYFFEDDYGEQWLVGKVDNDSIEVCFDDKEETNIMKEGESLWAPNNYFQVKFVQLKKTSPIDMEVEGSSRSFDVMYPAEQAGVTTFSTDAIYATWPNWNISDDEDEVVSIDTSGDPYKLTLPMDPWEGIVIGDRIYTWQYDEDEEAEFSVYYEGPGGSPVLAAAPSTADDPEDLDNVSVDVQFPVSFYDSDISPGNETETYTYNFFYNESADNVTIYWAAADRAPGVLWLKNGGRLMLNQSDEDDLYADFLDGSNVSVVMKYNASGDGWKKISGATFEDGAVGGADRDNFDEGDESDGLSHVQDYTDWGSRIYLASSGTLGITTYKDPVKGLVWVGGDYAGAAAAGASTAQFSRTQVGTTQNGITLNSFDITGDTTSDDLAALCQVTGEAGSGSIEVEKDVVYSLSKSDVNSLIVPANSMSASKKILVGGQIVNSQTASAGVTIAAGESKVTYANNAVIVAGYTAAQTMEAAEKLVEILDTYVKATA